MLGLIIMSFFFIFIILHWIEMTILGEATILKYLKIAYPPPFFFF